MGIHRILRIPSAQGTHETATVNQPMPQQGAHMSTIHFKATTNSTREQTSTQPRSFTL